MSGKPKPFFWIIVVLVAGALLYVGLTRIKDTGKTGEPGKNTGKRETATASKGFLDIAVYSSSAKKNWMNEMASRFNKKDVRVSKKTVRVKVIHVRSGESLVHLKRGKIKPDIWSPGDESWLQLAASYWQDIHGRPLFDTYTPLVDIPLVIAMWEPMAKVLGHPNPIGWQDIAKVAANPKGWNAYGHPEWGKFRWGHAHPDANSGFLTIISEVYAILGKTEGITPQDLKNSKVTAFLEQFEGAVEHYGLSNSWIDELMHSKGPSYLSAAVQYENTIIQANESYGNKPFKLVAIYPKEGCFHTQHPAAILDGAWMTRRKKDACQRFIDFLVSKTSQQRAMKMGLRPVLKEIKMSVPFDDHHGVTAVLQNQRLFKVPGERVLKRIRSLWESVKVPSTVILALDRSGSMKGKPMDNAKSGAVEFIKYMQPRDRIMVVVFNAKKLELTKLCPIKTCGEEAATRIKGIFAEGQTALYDTLDLYYKYLVQLKKKEPNRRYGLLLLSDGKDTSSKTERFDFLDTLPTGEDFDAPKIYAIAYGDEADKELLTIISRRTNARLFESTPDEIVRTYIELSANF